MIFALGWVPLYLARAENAGEALPFYSAAERLWVRLAPACVSVHITAACLFLSFSAPVPHWRACLSVLVFALGVGFWFWGRVSIGPLRVTRLPDEAPVRLRRDGAFGLVRHPLYFGVLVANAAPVIAAGRVFLLGTYLLCVVAILVRALQEERRLHAQLGAEYAAYCRDVQRIIPFVW